MKTLLMAVLMMAPKVTIDHTYEAKFLEQVNITNTAMRTYADTSCYDREIFHKAMQVFVTNITKLDDMTQKIPANQDTMIQTREIELMLGVHVLADDIITHQNECVDKRNKEDSKPNPSSTTAE